MSKTYDDEDILNFSNQEPRFSQLRVDNELFNEEDNNVINPVINIRRTQSHKNGENWEILVNDVKTLLLRGTRFTNLEKKYLRTIEGMQFLVSEYKKGKRSVVKIKEGLKK